MKPLLFLALLALFIVTFGGFLVGFMAAFEDAPKSKYQDLNKIDRMVMRQL